MTSLKQLEQQLIAAGITAYSHAEQCAVFSHDAYTTAKALPELVALPESTEQVQTLMAFAHALQVPVVTRGAGTGLAGGAKPVDGAVLLVTSKLQSIEPVEGTRMWVGAGVRNQAVSEAVRHLGLYFAPDPSSQSASSVGGNVAENSGGIHCVKYGVTVNNTHALEVVLSDGQLVTLGSEALDTAGLDLLAALHASEGLLGVVTRVCVKLLPIPPAQKLVVAGFKDLYVASEAVAEMFAEGLIPAALEVVDQHLLIAVEKLLGAGLPVDAGGLMLVEFDGTDVEVDAQIAVATAALERMGATSIEVSRDEPHRQRLWMARKAAFPALAMQSPDVLVLDGTVPRRALAPALDEINRLAADRGFRVMNAYHAGDGNLHPLVCFDADKGETEAAHDLGAEVLKICLNHGGTITGEHGVGIEKIDFMCLQFSVAENASMMRFKQAFDPVELLNPGKAIPTPHRCAEHGQMHLSAEQIEAETLERF